MIASFRIIALPLVIYLLLAHSPQILQQTNYPHSHPSLLAPAKNGIWPNPSGITILLMGEDPPGRFEKNISRAHDLGARWVQITFPIYQRNYTSDVFPIADRRTPAKSSISEAIVHAKKRGLSVALHPILLIQDKFDSHWRGQIQPTKRTRWYKSYRRWTKTICQIARDSDADLLVIGSELSSMQKDRTEWVKIVDLARSNFNKYLSYSANWDQWDTVSFFDMLDALGVNSYLPLSPGDSPNKEFLIQQLLPFRSQLKLWSRKNEVPLYFTEVGYPSHDQGLLQPWNQHAGHGVNEEIQSRGLEAFLSTFGQDPSISGLFFYALHGDGGPEDSGYTPVGKKSENLIQSYLTTNSKGWENRSIKR